MAALAAAAATVTPDALQQLQERYPEEDARKLFALCASKKGDVEAAAAVYEVTSIYAYGVSCHVILAQVYISISTPGWPKGRRNGGRVPRLLIR